VLSSSQRGNVADPQPLKDAAAGSIPAAWVGLLILAASVVVGLFTHRLSDASRRMPMAEETRNQNRRHALYLSILHTIWGFGIHAATGFLHPAIEGRA
jgi:hypothetical protein